MSEDKIKIKGENGGLMLGFPNDMPFSEIMEELSKKLDSGTGFFLRGTLVRVPRDYFSKEELAEVQELFRTHGLICRLAKPEPAVPLAAASERVQPADEAPQDAADAPDLQRSRRKGLSLSSAMSIPVRRLRRAAVWMFAALAVV